MNGSPRIERVLCGRQVEIEAQFSSLADYIWKLPHFIESEREIERDKLLSYFPDTGDAEVRQWHSKARELRFYHEFGKLHFDFPEYMASSCLVMVISKFEFHLLQISHDHELSAGVPLSSFKSRERGGAGKLLSYLAKVAPDHPPSPLVAQMKVSLRLRNCVAHANGVLAFAKDAEKIREIVSTRAYYPARRNPTEAESDFEFDPSIRTGSLGDWLRVPMLYSHWLCSAAKETLTSLCVEARPQSQ